MSRYLERHAENLDTHPWPFARLTFQRVVVVPAFDESPAFIEQLWQHSSPDSVLLLVVVNAPEDASPETITRTERLLNVNLADHAVRCTTTNGRAWRSASAKRAVWLIDRVTEGRRIPGKQGVGLARKLGLDLALQAIEQKRVAGPLIWSTDADCRWPARYFDVATASRDSVLTFAFAHVGDTASSPAQCVYDWRLRDYPAQLSRAGSRYGFLALGSAMAVSAEHYAQVRGCPKRPAGEDFHLLAKLAKVGTVHHCANQVVTLEARLSTRVPFGTGPGVARLAQGGDPWDAAIFYADKSFTVLRHLLIFFDQMADADPDRRMVQRGLQSVLAQASVTLTADAVFDVKQWSDAVLRATAASRNVVRRRQHLATWFDALRTLRLLHRLRDQGLLNASARELALTHPERLVVAGASQTQIDELAGALSG